MFISQIDLNHRLSVKEMFDCTHENCQKVTAGFSKRERKMSDIFVPSSSPEDALVGPLKTITYVTADPDGATKLLVDGMKLCASDWYVPDDHSNSTHGEYFGLNNEDKWKARHFSGEGAGANIQIRLISVDNTKGLIRPKVSGEFVGGLSIGFPVNHTEEHEKRLTALGYPSVVGVKRLEFTGPTGQTYISEEVHFPGPENIYILGVKRPDIFVPVGPMNNDLKLGAPAYSAVCTHDAEATIKFYRDVMGYEIRRDMKMTVGNNSGLLLKEGSDERFIQAFAPGSSTGYLVFLDHGDERKFGLPDKPLGPPNRGVCMWSFPSADIELFAERARANNAKILRDIDEVDSLFIGRQKTLMLEDPTGHPLEIYEV